MSLKQISSLDEKNQILSSNSYFAIFWQVITLLFSYISYLLHNFELFTHKSSHGQRFFHFAPLRHVLGHHNLFYIIPEGSSRDV